MTDPYQPKPEDRFTFGLWTVGNRGRDPFGEAVRSTIPPTTIVETLARLGAYGVNLHDNDLIPINATAAQRDKIVKEFKKALADNNMKVPMATTNLFFHPIFKDGAFTSNDPKVRSYALAKTMDAIDLGHDLGARIYVFWGGREGAEVDAARDPRDAIKWFRECMNFLCEYVIDNKYQMKFALEAKPNEPRSDIYLPTTGAMLAFIATLGHPEMVGVNPEYAHETMPGLNFHHAVAQALEAKKLFHIDLNGQKPGKFDQDLRFASEDQKGCFFLVKILEDSGWDGPRHFDAHAYRTEDEAGVWDFALGCMRSYNILKEKVKRFNADPEIQGILGEIRAMNKNGWLGAYSKKKGDAIRSKSLDINQHALKGLKYEKLDQLTTELLLGVR
ncbi:MAG TPA: xylose isomerase [Acidobacteriota bacterium]|nr:xylose isomerase [Acidobacteriota bacterium]